MDKYLIDTINKLSLMPGNKGLLVIPVFIALYSAFTFTVGYGAASLLGLPAAFSGVVVTVVALIYSMLYMVALEAKRGNSI